jgi:acetyltransferase-like isoleucine patch superfamily enzyme
MATPWKAWLEARRLVWQPLIRAVVGAHGVAWGRGWRIYGLPVIQRHRASTIAVGDDFELRSWYRSNPLGPQRSVLSTRAPGARLDVGAGVKASGVVVCAQQSITIGDRVRLGCGVMVIDTDFHPKDAGLRAADPRAGQSAPVVIGNDVFVGARAIILKGTHLGDGCVVGAGSVVSGTFAPGTTVAGNPARVIGAP